MTLPPLPITAPVVDGTLAPWKIVQLVDQNGEFAVSWRYRDERLMRRCRNLCKQGWLKQRRTRPGQSLFMHGGAA